MFTNHITLGLSIVHVCSIASIQTEDVRSNAIQGVDRSPATDSGGMVSSHSCVVVGIDGADGASGSLERAFRLKEGHEMSEGCWFLCVGCSILCYLLHGRLLSFFGFVLDMVQP